VRDAEEKHESMGCYCSATVTVSLLALQIRVKSGPDLMKTRGLRETERKRRRRSREGRRRGKTAGPRTCWPDATARRGG